MDEFQTIIIFLIVLIQFLKTWTNWVVWHILNPKERVPFDMSNPSYSQSYEEIQKSHDSFVLLFSCMIIQFWVKIPKSKMGKRMAWSVLVFTIIQVLAIVYVISLNQ